MQYIVYEGKDGDKIVFTNASYDLHLQLKDFIEVHIEGAEVTIKPIEEKGRKYYRLYVYSCIARMLAELLYADCYIVLDRKLAQAQQMFESFSLAR
jgi:hypothetical protein